MRLYHDHVFTADKLSDVLNGIESELDASLSINNKAVQALGINRFGYCSEIYCEQAENLWLKQWNNHPDDPETLHHLAVLYHARAFDAEIRNKSKKSDSDWKQALDFWRELINHDGFWNKFNEILVGDNSDKIDEVRAKLPQLLLCIHVGIAYSPSTPSNRAKFHIKLALSAGFQPEHLDAARLLTYEHITSDLPDEVWGGEIDDNKILTVACEKIRKILMIDPECIHALQDVARIQVHMLMNDLHRCMDCEDDTKKVQSILRDLNKVSGKWLPYFEFLLVQKNLPEEIKEHLFKWLRYMGMVKHRLDDYAGAVILYDKAIALDLVDEPDYKELVTTATETQALNARELTDTNATRAKSECRKAVERTGQTCVSHFIIAQTYQELDEHVYALNSCNDGIELLNTGDDDPVWRERLTGLKLNIEIRKHLKAKNFAQAKDLLTKAIAVKPGSLINYFLRCQCYIALKNSEAANEDIRQIEQLAESKDAIDALNILKKQMAELDMTDNYLGPAKDAMEKGDFKKAKFILAEAIVAGFDEFVTYFLLCQCNLAERKLQAAQKTIKTLDKLAVSASERKAVRSLRGQVSDLDQATNYLDPAVEATKRNDYARAISLLSDAIKHGYGDFSVYFLRCQNYVMNNNMKAGMKDLDKCSVIASKRDEKKAVRDLKDHLKPKPPSGYDEQQKLASDLFSQLSGKFPSDFPVDRNACIKYLRFAIQFESSRWSRNSVNSVVDTFFSAVQADPGNFVKRGFILSTRKETPI